MPLRVLYVASSKPSYGARITSGFSAAIFSNGYLSPVSSSVVFAGSNWPAPQAVVPAAVRPYVTFGIPTGVSPRA